MYDIEMVVVTDSEATKTNEGIYRYTERVANMEIAQTTLDALSRKMTGEKILTMANVVQSYGHGSPYTLSAAYVVPGGGIVGFVNINEVVGE
ncbi:hypothetical protein SEA_GENEVAB15_157 [Mycobacterium phage GenevaB15]|nr:hypothetical protein SEA_GENEVAB15_157 [Mycobacterium phage GenevaB15]